MNRPMKHNAAGSPCLPAAAPSPSAPVCGGGATYSGAASPSQTEAAGAPNRLNLSYRCPDCSGPFTYRIVDEDTGCRYPVDDGEHYCLSCDAVWSDDDLPLSGWALAEQRAVQ